MTSCYHGQRRVKWIERHDLFFATAQLPRVNFLLASPAAQRGRRAAGGVISPELWNHRLPTALLTTSQRPPLTAEAVKRR